MRISAWSSDVCSSDLDGGLLRAGLRVAPGGLGQCVDRRSLGQRRRLDRLGLRQRRHGGLGEGGRGHRKGGEAGKTVGTGVAHELGSGIPLVTRGRRSEEHTSELQSLMRISYAVFCLKKKKNNKY